MSGNPILAKIQAAMNAILAYLNGIKGRFFAIGADIVDGLDAGMNSRLGVLRKTAAQMAAVVEDASRKRLDTHSPSRVMMAVGRNVVAGLDVGMGRRFVPMLKNFRANVGRLASPENVARITKAMDGIGRATGSDDVAGDLVRMVAPALGKNHLLGHLLDISVSGLSAYAKYQTTPTPKPVSIKPVSSAPAMMANAVSSQSMNTTSNFTIHIHADKGMDERSLAQKVRAELERYEQTKAARYRARLTD
ncbi:hypothetical protein [Moraxella sp. ZY200743]|uniref:hypothetical protein n=1 Tax=Moraxella sp. ZY200743 TaxID=2911970 RepID=UPI003D7D47BB